MVNKRRGRKPLNIPDEEKRRPCTVRASKDEYEVVKAFVRLLRIDQEKCRDFVGLKLAFAPTQSISPGKNAIRNYGKDVSGLTDEQKAVFNAMAAGHNVFLSGGAGTGKTYVLRKFMDYAENKGKNILRMAPTGIAARLIGGATIHRTIHAPTTVIGPDNFQETTYASQMGEKVYEVIAQTDIIIVDEISMCRSDLFSYLAKIILAEDHPHQPFFESKKRKARNGKKPKPIQHHIQVILCGDFAQLPPIIGKESQEVWHQCYPSNDGGWAFFTDQWDALKLQIFDLKKVLRQSDPDFSEALNLIRRGDSTGIEYLNKNSA